MSTIHQNQVPETKKSIGEIQNEMNDKMSEVFETLGIFFAFSDEQFQRQKKEGVIYVDGGAGLIIPKENIAAFKNSFLEIDRETKQEYDKNTTMDEYILHELINHEAFYTCDLDDTIEAVSLVYPECTFDDVYRIYGKNIKKYN